MFGGPIKDSLPYVRFPQERRAREPAPASPLTSDEFDSLAAALGALRSSGEFPPGESPIPRLHRAVLAGPDHARAALTYDGTRTLIRELRRCVSRLRTAEMEADATIVGSFAAVVEGWGITQRPT